LEHLAREKFPVLKSSEIGANSPHISKWIFEIDVCEFESRRPTAAEFEPNADNPRDQLGFDAVLLNC
jgi:hypothetical protein